MITKTCEWCKKEFRGYRSKRSFCSVSCRDKSYAIGKSTLTCLHCGGTFVAYRGKYCSYKCRYEDTKEHKKDAANERSRKYRLEHPEYLKEYSKKWREENKEKIKEYLEKNKEKLQIKRKEYALKNKDKIKERNKKWRKTEKGIAMRRRCSARYKKLHPEKAVEHRQRRRANLYKAEGSYTVQEWLELVERYGGKCLCCGEVKPLTVDHVVPISCGGSNSIDNIQPLCQSCNSQKGIKIIDYR